MTKLRRKGAPTDAARGFVWDPVPSQCHASGFCLPLAVGPRPFKIWGPPLILSLQRPQSTAERWEMAGGREPVARCPLLLCSQQRREVKVSPGSAGAARPAVQGARREGMAL